MNIMDLFRGGAAKQETPPNPGDPNPQNMQTQQTQQTAPNGTVPNNGVTNPDPNATPLDKHKDIWNTDNTKDPTAFTPVFGEVDTKKIGDALSNVDIAGNVLTPEIRANLAKGGEDAAAAFAQGMNNVARAVITNQTATTAKIVEQALAKQQTQFMEMLPTIIRRTSAQEALVTENPLLAHPSMQPIVEALQSSFSRKNPNASSKEIATQVQDVFASMAQAFGKPAASDTANNKGSGDDFDWLAWSEKK